MSDLTTIHPSEPISGLRKVERERRERKSPSQQPKPIPPSPPETPGDEPPQHVDEIV